MTLRFAAWSPRRLEVAVVAAATLAIQVLAFRGYYTGATSPGADFLSTYNTEAYAWWHDGGIIDPPDWVPYIWGGFPAALQVQNSAWYLPTGLIAWLTPYDIQAASVAQALHVALAGVGVHVLLRRAGFRIGVATVGLVSYSFVTGFFAEAPYVDIVHGFALLPWVLIVLSPLWPWHRSWAVPAAAVVLWQAAVGIYPGMLVTIAYTGLAWVAGWQLARRLRVQQYLVPLFLSGALAALLALPRFLPALSLGTMDRTSLEDLSVFGPSTVATVLLPAHPTLPGVFSLNLLFVPAAVVVLALLASLRRPVARIALASFAVAMLITLPLPVVGDVVGLLPGVGLSRFRLNDAFPLLALMAVVLAASGLERLLSAQWQQRPLRRRLLAAAVAVVPLVVAVLAVTVGQFGSGPWRRTFAVLTATTVCVVVLALMPPVLQSTPRLRAAIPAACLAVLAAASGLMHAQSASTLWNIDTVSEQQRLWGATSAQLIQHDDGADAVQRPARVPVNRPATAAEYGRTEYNSVFYTGDLSLAGYFAVKNSAAYVSLGQALADPEIGTSALAFWEAGGMLHGSADGALPTPAESARCATTGTCGELDVTPLAYTGEHLSYAVSVRRPTTVIANEAFYPGWQVLVTGAGGTALTPAVGMGETGCVTFTLPEGEWTVSMVYETPRERPGRTAFLLGLAGIGAALLLGVRRRAAGGGAQASRDARG